MSLLCKLGVSCPPRLSYSWPLTPGKTWQQDSREERPVDGQTTNRNSVWAVDAEETVAVPAGTFRALKIVWRNRNTNAVLYEVWYVPAVKQWVKLREVLSNGVRKRELESFKLDPDRRTDGRSDQGRAPLARLNQVRRKRNTADGIVPGYRVC